MRPSRPPSAWLLPFALAALLARPAFADEPSLAATPDTLRADEQGSWNTTATLHNPLAVGLFPDSLCVDLEDGDPGVPSGPRAYTLREDAMAGAMGAIGGGEDHTFSWMLAAPFERGGVTLRLHLHDHDGHAFVVRHTLVADGGPLSDSLPSTFATAGGRRVEVVLAAPR
ncbi:MAG TPA: hypothetical protein VGU27_06540, partial [Candidatus Eisenbacteria bacterium]|nr:hypothetical protein [Candidatus Eisenbacteria bacterium]